MSKEGELWRAACSLVRGNKTAIMTTADPDGLPHAAWMTVSVDEEMVQVVSITASTSQKVDNLYDNPQAEWMFSSPSLETLVYLSGPTVIVPAEEARRYWDAMPGKSKAYYRNFSDPEDPENFTIIRTHVNKVVYCRPTAYKKTVIHEIKLAE